MNVKIVQREPVKIAYLRHVGSYGRPLLDFWQKTVYPWLRANDLLGQPRYGVGLDVPTVTNAAQCRYDAGVEVRGKLAEPGESKTETIPGGRYAMTPFRGTVDQVAGTFDAMLRDWLPKSGMRLDVRPFFEYYPPDANFDPKTGIFNCEIAIPVTEP